MTIALFDVPNMPFQVGVGASGKNIRLGASAWFDYVLSYA